jgi:ABC-type nickel/cobalt efflux system permease component RcnA
MLDSGILIVSGALAGGLHVLAGPDHLAAVTPLAADSRARAWRTGFAWGLGHTGGVLLIGALAILLRGILPLDALSSVSERIVGIALIGVGIWGLRRAMRLRIHLHSHVHDGSAHSHLHVHDRHTRHDPARERDARHTHVHASLSFGVLHGLAGSSHLFGVLPALALPTRAGAALYLAGFGAGTVLAMSVYTNLAGLLAARARGAQGWAYQGLLYACSIAAICVGGFWLAG